MLKKSDDEILNLLIAGNKMEAVTLYQKTAMVGLAQAKKYVEQLTEEKAETQFTDELEPRLISYIKQNKKVLAVKLFAETKKVDIATAYEHVNQLLKKHHIADVKTNEEGFLLHFAKFVFEHSTIVRLFRKLWAWTTGDRTKD